LTPEVATRKGSDYYAVLGVPRNADRDAIRRAFRSLASEFHPDVSPDPNAVERFLEIAEAYEVLSRPEARARYDRFGFDPRAVSDFAAADTDFSRLFQDLLDLASAVQPSGRRGNDVAVELEVDFSEAHKGSSRGVHYSALSVCIVCAGAGGAPRSTMVACTDCDGRGRIREGGGSGRPSHLRVCATCRGTGRCPSTPCAECDGAGRLEVERALLVEIPPDTRDGEEIRIPGEGNAGSSGGEPGDAVITVRVRPARDTPLARRLAAAGAICGLGLLAYVIVMLVLPD
jgi:molecular chaperone DnaJ